MTTINIDEFMNNQRHQIIWNRIAIELGLVRLFIDIRPTETSHLLTYALSSSLRKLFGRQKVCISHVIRDHTWWISWDYLIRQDLEVVSSCHLVPFPSSPRSPLLRRRGVGGEARHHLDNCTPWYHQNPLNHWNCADVTNNGTSIRTLQIYH